MVVAVRVNQAKARRPRAKKRSDRSAAGHPLVAELAERADTRGQTKISRPPIRLSHDRRNMDAGVVDASQRWRLLAATARVMARDGYGLTTIDKITSEAGVTKKTFYKFFPTKEDAFLACYEAIDVVIDGVATAGLEAKGTAEALRVMVSRYLAALAAVPDLTRIFLFEAIAASPRIRRHRAAYIERFVAGFLRVVTAQRANDPSLPPVTIAEMTALLGGINELCVLEITRHDVASVLTLEDAVCRFVLRFLKAG
jgi:AcrR family transcriptional regulator